MNLFAYTYMISKFAYALPDGYFDKAVRKENKPKKVKQTPTQISDEKLNEILELLNK